MEDCVLKLQEDLRKRLDRLCLMHNEPALYVAEHFAELRKQVDLDAERLLSEIQSVKRKTGKAPKDSDVNETRLEFIRILGELEKRTGVQPKPQAPASEVYVSLEQRVDAFKGSSNLLDDLEDLYVKLAREITDESDRVEKRHLGEQTIIYWPSKEKDQLGSLVYFGDVFLSRVEIDRLISNIFSNEDQSSGSELVLVSSKEFNELSKCKQVVDSLGHQELSKFASESKFFYIGKTKEEYSGYSAEGSSIGREFVSYQLRNKDSLFISRNDFVDTSASLFDVYSPKNCILHIGKMCLDSLHIDLLPSPVTRLTGLYLTDVHLESFDTDLLATCTNLIQLRLKTTFSKSVKFDFNFLGALRKLETLHLALPKTPSDLSLFKDLTELKNLTLEGASFFYAEKMPKLSKAVLKQILSPPLLQTLKLACFDIEIIDREMFSECRRLWHLGLSMNRVSSNSALDIGFPACFPHSNAIKFESRYSLQMGRMNLFRNDIQTLSTESFARMSFLKELSLGDNLINDLPPGIFDDLSNLEYLLLNKNLIRHVRYGVFNRLTKLKELTMRDNPIESVTNILHKLIDLLPVEKCVAEVDETAELGLVLMRPVDDGLLAKDALLEHAGLIGDLLSQLVVQLFQIVQRN